MKILILSLALIFGAILAFGQTHIVIRKGSATRDKKTDNYSVMPSLDSVRILCSLKGDELVFHSEEGKIQIGERIDVGLMVDSVGDTTRYWQYNAFDKVMNTSCQLMISINSLSPGYVVAQVIYRNVIWLYLLMPYTEPKKSL